MEELAIHIFTIYSICGVIFFLFSWYVSGTCPISKVGIPIAVVMIIFGPLFLLVGTTKVIELWKRKDELIQLDKLAQCEDRLAALVWCHASEQEWQRQKQKAKTLQYFIHNMHKLV